MAKFDWSEEQLQVINSVLNNTLVSASAGSGKTAVMVERIIRLIVENNVSIKRVLMVTFTEAVAKELRSKISDALKKVAQEQSENYEFIRQQIELLPMCHISTLHALCNDLIRRNFDEVQIDPSFGILEESSKEMLLSKAINESLEKQELSGNEYVDDLKRLFGNRMNFIEKLGQLYKFIVAQPDRQYYLEYTLFDMVNGELNYHFFAIEYVKQLHSQIANIVNELQDFIPCLENSDMPFFVDLCNCYCKHFNELLQLENLKYVLSYIQNNNLHIPSLSGKANFGKNQDKKSLYKELSPYLDSAKNLLEDIKKLAKDTSYEEHSQSVSRQIPYIKCISNIIKDTITFYTDYKKQENKLDFDDLEFYASKLLEDESLSQSIGGECDFICVDEYQDINNVQENIIARLSKSSNLFMVGDVKQSIYGFRHTDPTIFLGKSEVFDQDSTQGVNKTLNKNYRSSKQVIDFVNSIFDEIMTEDFGKINYAKTSRLGFGLTQMTATVENAVEVVRFDKIEQTKQSFMPEDEIYSVKQHNSTKFEQYNQEAFYIADKISQLVGVEDICELVGGQPTYRKIKFSDIMILCMSRKEAVYEIIRYLNAVNIPVDSSAISQSERDPNIGMLVDYIKVLSNSKQDYALIGLMCGFFGGFDYSDMAYIRSLDPKSTYFYQAYEKALLQENKLSQRLADFANKLEHYRTISQSLTVSSLIKTIIIDSAFDSFLLAQRGGECNLVAINNFIESLNGKTYDNSIFAFIEVIEEMPAMQKSKDISFIQNDCVGVTTIHSSKGLQYPIVFMVDSARQFSDSESKEKLIYDKKFGMIMRSFDPIERLYTDNILFELLKRYRHKEELLEKTRLLYVALTRAQNMLFVTATANTPKEAKSLDKCNCFFDFIYHVCEKDQKFALDYYKEFKNFSPQEDDELAQNQTLLFKKADKNLVDKVLVRFEDNYKYKNAVTMGIKHTVTAINNEATQDIQMEYGAVAYIYPDGVDKSIVGTAYHKIMELVDLDCPTKEDLLLNIKEMQNAGKLSQEQFDSVDCDKIWECLQSDLISWACKHKHYREKQFMLYIPANRLLESDVEDKILLQGTIDMLVIGEKNVIVDFKLSEKSDEYIKAKYAKQMDLYQLAVENCMGIKIHQKIIYVLGANRIIEM